MEDLRPFDIVNYKGNICIVVRINRERREVWAIDIGGNVDSRFDDKNHSFDFERLISPDKAVVLCRCKGFEYAPGSDYEAFDGKSERTILADSFISGACDICEDRQK